MSACTKLERSFEAPEPFSSRSSITALLPNTSSKPNFSKSLWIWIVVLPKNHYFFRKVHFQYPLFHLECPLFHSQYPLLYPQCSLFLRSKVHLYEVFDYEARFSRSKVDFWETLPDGSINQIFRWFESVHCLKSDCRTPSIPLMCFIRFRLPQIFLKRVFFHIHYHAS